MAGKLSSGVSGNGGHWRFFRAFPMLTAEQRWLETWKKAGPVLERIRQAELDQARG